MTILGGVMEVVDERRVALRELADTLLELSENELAWLGVALNVAMKTEAQS